MGLTPMDIHNKEFRRGFRGYRDDEVDEFLDEVVASYEKVYKENMEINEKMGLLEAQISNYKSIENVLNETLIVAQKTADEIIANAKNKAEMIIQSANEDGRNIIRQANGEVVEIGRRVDDSKKFFEIFKNRFKSFLETQMELIEKEKFDYCMEETAVGLKTEIEEVSEMKEVSFAEQEESEVKG